MKVCFPPILALASLAALSGCATGASQVAPPAQVTRTHLNQPIARATIAIEPLTATEAGSLGYQAGAAALARQLTRLGWTLAPPGSTASEQVATVRVAQGVGAPGGGSPVSVGIGGGAGSHGGGVGAGISVPLGRRAGPTVLTSMEVRIRRRSDGSAIWEARGAVPAPGGSADAQLTAAAEKLAFAMFQDFPGESGRTISVR